MATAGDPLIPTAYDVMWTVVLAVIVSLAVVALVSIARNAKWLTPIHALVWTLLVIFVPVLGPVAWLSIGRRAKA